MYIKEWLPNAYKIGISWNEFWEMTPRIINSIAKGYNDKKREEIEIQNIIAHLQGGYVIDAIRCTIGNIGKCGVLNKYPQKPYEIFENVSNSQNSESNEELAVFEMKQRVRQLEKLGLKQSPG